MVSEASAAHHFRTPRAPARPLRALTVQLIPLTQLMGTACRRMSARMEATEEPKSERGAMERKQSNE